MYILTCRDFNIICDFVARDETIEGVIRKLYEHGRGYHTDAMQDVEDKMKQMGQERAFSLILSKIREEQVVV